MLYEFAILTMIVGSIAIFLVNSLLIYVIYRWYIRKYIKDLQIKRVLLALLVVAMVANILTCIIYLSKCISFT